MGKIFLGGRGRNLNWRNVWVARSLKQKGEDFVCLFVWKLKAVWTGGRTWTKRTGDVHTHTHTHNPKDAVMCARLCAGNQSQTFYFVWATRVQPSSNIEVDVVAQDWTDFIPILANAWTDGKKLVLETESVLRGMSSKRMLGFLDRHRSIHKSWRIQRRRWRTTGCRHHHRRVLIRTEAARARPRRVERSSSLVRHGAQMARAQLEDLLLMMGYDQFLFACARWRIRTYWRAASGEKLPMPFRAARFRSPGDTIYFCCCCVFDATGRTSHRLHEVPKCVGIARWLALTRYDAIKSRATIRVNLANMHRRFVSAIECWFFDQEPILQRSSHQGLSAQYTALKLAPPHGPQV